MSRPQSICDFFCADRELVCNVLNCNHISVSFDIFLCSFYILSPDCDFKAIFPSSR